MLRNAFQPLVTLLCIMRLGRAWCTCTSYAYVSMCVRVPVLCVYTRTYQTRKVSEDGGPARPPCVRFMQVLNDRKEHKHALSTAQSPGSIHALPLPALALALPPASCIRTCRALPVATINATCLLRSAARPSRIARASIGVLRYPVSVDYQAEHG